MVLRVSMLGVAQRRERDMVKACTLYCFLKMRKLSNRRQHNAIKTAVHYVQTGKGLSCMPRVRQANLSSDLKKVLQYTVSHMVAEDFTQTVEQRNHQWVVFYWGEPQVLDYLERDGKKLPDHLA
jgi:hypothetical protein